MSVDTVLHCLQYRMCDYVDDVWGKDTKSVYDNDGVTNRSCSRGRNAWKYSGIASEQLLQ
jgi:hypothetical protein